MMSHEEYEGLTTGRSNLMCLPLSFSAICCSGGDSNGSSFTFSKVVLTPEETRNYQIPWEKQQKQIKAKKKSLCLCWCCFCSCSCKPMCNRKNRRVENKLEKRTNCYQTLIETARPTVEQVHKWSSSFDEVVRDSIGLKLFEIFLQQEHSDENINFWVEVNMLKDIEDAKEKKEKVKDIYNEYLKPMAQREVNISGTARRKIEEELTAPAGTNDMVFDTAQQQVFLMMLRQSYPRFLTSDLFHSVVQTTYAYAVNPNAIE